MLIPHRVSARGIRASFSYRYSQITDLAVSPMGVFRSMRPLPTTSNVPFFRSVSPSRNFAISLSLPGVSRKTYSIARSRASRNRWAGVLASAGAGSVSRSSGTVGTVLSSRPGGSMSERGFSPTYLRCASQLKNRLRRRYWALVHPWRDA